MKKYSIAIDGPSGSGKSSAAKLLAHKLGFLYVNTGAMYRAYAYYLNELNLNNSLDEEWIDALKKANFVFEGDNVFVNDKDISEIIRYNNIANLASVFSQNKKIREYATNQQRLLAQNNNVVMDGRDIGTIVLVDADLKIYLNTSIEERAKRRLLQNQNLDNNSYETIYNEIKLRDENDMNRAIAPLKKADDAIEIFNDGMNLEQCVDELMKIVVKQIK